MIVNFEKSFAKSLKKIGDKKILNKIEKVILEYEKAENLQNISGIKKLVGFSNFYRVRIGRLSNRNRTYR